MGRTARLRSIFIPQEGHAHHFSAFVSDVNRDLSTLDDVFQVTCSACCTVSFFEDVVDVLGFSTNVQFSTQAIFSLQSNVTSISRFSSCAFHSVSQGARRRRGFVAEVWKPEGKRCGRWTGLDFNWMLTMWAWFGSRN